MRLLPRRAGALTDRRAARRASDGSLPRESRAARAARPVCHLALHRPRRALQPDRELHATARNGAPIRTAAAGPMTDRRNVPAPESLPNDVEILAARSGGKIWRW